MQAALARPTHLPRWLIGLAWVGPILLYLAGTGFGILEVHSSTDTFIGLAGGKQIVEQTDWRNVRQTFPVKDTFSYTFYGQPWFNQNWLTHVWQYWLYSRIAPDAVIYGTWAISAAIFLFVLLGTYWRCHTWLGAVLAAGVVAIGSRDFLSPRPATTGFFLMAAQWALVCALEGQRDKRRWWPILLQLPLLVIWDNAHGSFIFGYTVLAMYVGHWIVVRLRDVPWAWPFTLILPLLLFAYVAAGDRPNLLFLNEWPWRWLLLPAYTAYWLAARFTNQRLAASGQQVIAIALVMALGLLAAVITSPFGLDNLRHGDKVAGSEVFRGVQEWHPPFANINRSFPHMERFWWILGCCGGGLLGAWLLGAILALRVGRRGPEERRTDLSTSLFEIALAVLGLSMTLWARRFAPMLYIFAAPAFVGWLMLLTRPAGGRVRERLRFGLMAAALVGGIVTAGITVTRVQRGLVERFRDLPHYDLLWRVTRFDTTPTAAFNYLRDNGLRANLLTEWTLGGIAMFYLPDVRVYIDGRSQQVYSEEHYVKYNTLLNSRVRRQERLKLIDEVGTDAVLLRNQPHLKPLWELLWTTPGWVMALHAQSYEDQPEPAEPGFVLFVREDSPVLRQIGARVRRGEEQRPDTPEALGALGAILVATDPPERERAVECWHEAVERRLLLGELWWPHMVQALVDLGRGEDARVYLYRQRQRVSAARELDGNLRRILLNVLDGCRNSLERGGPLRARDGPGRP